MTTKRAKTFLENEVGPLTLGDLLYSIRFGEEMTQDQFAKQLGISKSHLCDLEKRRKFASPARAARFAKKLGYPTKQFLRLAFQDQLLQAGLMFKVSIEEMA